MIFVLAASSIGCLLADFYKLCSMSWFARFIFLPAFVVLCIVAILDIFRGNGVMGRTIWVGLFAGLIAAVTYDLFRLPFVFAREWRIDSIVPPMDLFKVFPRFGAMLFREPLEQAHYALKTETLGWLYHFSNGATFGVMYLALVGNPLRRHWSWAVLFAVALELGMLLTPYPAVFGIRVTPRFVAVTLAAHALFGAGLGLSARWLFEDRRGRLRCCAGSQAQEPRVL